MLYHLSYGPLTSNRLPFHLHHETHHATNSTTPSFSGQGRNRTTDTTIFSRVLYQLSYLAQKKIRPGLSATGGSARGARSVCLEAPLDGRPSRARPRVRHRPSPGLLRIGPEH